MAHIGRRTFLVGLALAPAFSAVAGAAIPPVGAFVATSGRRSEGLLVAGLLTVAQPEVREARIDRLRATHGYRRALRYMSTDRGKAGFAAALIDDATADLGLCFAALVAQADLHLMPRSVDLHRRLIADAGIAVIHVRDTDRGRTGLSALATDQPNLTVDPCRRSNLTDLASFLSGCVYGEIANVANPLKRKLSARLWQRADPVRFAVATWAV